MKKDKEWFKQQMVKNYPTQSEIDNPDYEVIAKIKIIDEVLSLIDQLDKPELPVIPRFVADYLSNVDVYSFEERIEILVNSHSGDSYYFHEMLPKDGHISYELGDQLYEYAQNEKLANLFRLINGYTIEKEKLYKVLLPGVESLDRQMCMHEETKVVGFADDGYNSRKYSEDDKFIRLFTEQEIKSIDERYWAFREEVTDNA